ncbi:MAG: hypothetical protein QNJ88_13565 [Acidimicrobiia bacterium]|nr:hypothetical protein [Acidimicrobiia bacterium]
MLLRIRWFVVGFLTATAAAAYVIDQVRRAREKLTPENLTRSGARGVAALIDAAAERIAPTNGHQADTDDVTVN